jgi:hypothetical protein
MGPVRTITELLFAPAVAITRSDRPTFPQPGAPPGPGAPGPGRPSERHLRGLGRFLAVGLAGLVMLVTGLIWDAVVHARRPELAHEESLFSFSNPGHLLLFAGILTAAAGLAGAAWTRLGLGSDPRSSRRARTLLLCAMAYMAALSVVALTQAAGAEAAAGHDQAAEAVAGHDHTAEAAAGYDQAAEAEACQPTSTQLAAAGRLVSDTRRGVARFADLRAALAAGYAPHHRVPEPIKHYFNPAYVTDGRVLDRARPEGLLYAHTHRGPVLVATVYLMNRADEPGSAVGGCLTQWHAHDNLCSSDPARGMITGLHAPGRPCSRGQVPWAAPPMLHTWVIDTPGPFARQIDVDAVFGQLGAVPRASA